MITNLAVFGELHIREEVQNSGMGKQTKNKL